VDQLEELSEDSPARAYVWRYCSRLQGAWRSKDASGFGRVEGIKDCRDQESVPLELED